MRKNAHNSKKLIVGFIHIQLSSQIRIFLFYFTMINAIKQKQSILQQERDKKIRLAMEERNRILQERCNKLHTIMKTALDECVRSVMDLENKNNVVCSCIFQDETTNHRGYARDEIVTWMNKYNSSIGRTDGITLVSGDAYLGYQESKFRCIIDKCIMDDNTLQIFLDIA